MHLRQLFDSASSTFSYLVFDEKTKDGVLIDSVFEQHARDAALVRELGIQLKFTLDTHVHADHVTGAWLMRRELGSKIGFSRASGVEGADLLFDPGESVVVGDLKFEVIPTPGHTAGCVTYFLAKERIAFSGDALLIRGAGRTDFQQGDAGELFRSVRGRLFSLPDETLVYPAHDYSGRNVTTISEEKRFNPRLGESVREQDFIGFMQNLNLPHPGKLDVAVPANLHVGRPPDDWQQKEMLPDWGPVTRTYAGVLQVEPEWVRAHQREVLLLDVRETAEIESAPLKAIAGSRNVPLSRLRSELDTIEKDRPLIAVCPTGARSAMAATILEKAGAPRVANLRGGLFEWMSLGYSLGEDR